MHMNTQQHLRLPAIVSLSDLSEINKQRVLIRQCMVQVAAVVEQCKQARDVRQQARALVQQALMHRCPAMHLGVEHCSVS
jgi:hypothetical protein